MNNNNNKKSQICQNNLATHIQLSFCLTALWHPGDGHWGKKNLQARYEAVLHTATVNDLPNNSICGSISI